MKLYTEKNGSLESISSVDFKLEQDIQNIIEKNMEELFGLQFVKSELTINNFRLDTLGFDKEAKSFVIIEYKKDKNFSVIDQGYSYMSTMLNNKSDFILEYNETCNKTLKRDDIDWSQSRVIFISPQFTEYQKHSVNFKDVPFELWEIKKYKNNLIGLIQHKTTSSESISSVGKNKGGIVKKVTGEVKHYNEEYHLYGTVKNRPEWIIELYSKFKERILNLGDVEIKYTGKYISFRRNSPFADIVVYQQGLYTIINLKEGTLDDPKNEAKSFDGKGHWGNGDYYILINQDTDLNYAMFLINQSYKAKK